MRLSEADLKVWSKDLQVKDSIFDSTLVRLSVPHRPFLPFYQYHCLTKVVKSEDSCENLTVKGGFEIICLHGSGCIQLR